MLQASVPLAVRTRIAPARQVGLAIAVSAAAGVAVAAANSWLLVVSAMGALFLVGLGLYAPAAFFGVMLLARPMLDASSTTNVGPTNPPGVLGLALVALATILVLTRPRALKPPVAGAFLIVVIVTGIGVYVADANFGGVVGSKPVAEWVRVLALVAVYVLAANLFGSAEGVKRMFLIIAVSGFGPAIWGCWEWVTGDFSGAALANGDTFVHRASGSFNSPVAFGMFLAVPAILLLGMPKAWIQMRWRVFLLVPIMAGLVASYSRSGWALFLIAFIVMSLWGNKWLLPAGVTLIVATLVVIPSVEDRILPKKNYVAEEQTFGSYRFRIENWTDLVAQAEEKPIFGYGTNTTNFINVRRPASSDISDPGGGFDAHNSAVRLFVEGGVLLLSAWLFFIVLLGARLKTLVSRFSPFKRPARLVAALWIGTALVGLTSDDPTGSTAIMATLFALTGALDGAFPRRLPLRRRTRKPRLQEAAGRTPILTVPPTPRTTAHA